MIDARNFADVLDVIGNLGKIYHRSRMFGSPRSKVLSQTFAITCAESLPGCTLVFLELVIVIGK